MVEKQHPATTKATLSEREEAFVLAVARGLPPYRAAASVGYSPCHAYALIRRVNVLETLREVGINLSHVVRNCLPPRATP